MANSTLVRGRRPTGWLVVLGVALGGFFDGILLHQILQWHHLFSLVSSIVSLRAQVLWDGYFHAAMYALAGLALWRIWRAPAEYEPMTGRTFPALLIGFGLWHVVDTLVSHWVLGIHRVRVDSEQPLLWDLLWLVAFGIIPIVLGWMMRRRPSARGSRNGRAGSVVPLLTLALSTVVAGLWALVPPAEGPRLTTVVFAPWTQPAQAWSAIGTANARLAWVAPDMSVVVIDAEPGDLAALYLRGAMFVGGTGLPAGCTGWTRV